MNEISKVCHEETQKMCSFSEQLFEKFVNFQEKHSDEIAFLSKVAGYIPDTYWECSSGKFMKFSAQVS